MRLRATVNRDRLAAMNEDSSEARKATSEAISSGWATRG